ncbi:MAG: hypothetical protein L6Q57_01830 [Alphaproteobacteria bacterium]|nr:hypothetical protein [Alphaproteobacteria bacterium]
MKHSCQSGSALVYVIIAIALFAALSFTLARQTDNSEAGALSQERADLYATQILNYAAQAKGAVDRMIWGGSTIAGLEFLLPGEAGYDEAANSDNIHKVFHPEGGGLNPGMLNADYVAQEDAAPPPGWYMGRFNNIDWTNTSATDIILTAYQINAAVCAKINEKLTGSATIPTLNGNIKDVLIDENVSTNSGSNADFTTSGGGATCTSCAGKGSLCVKDGALDTYAFYAVMAER